MVDQGQVWQVCNGEDISIELFIDIRPIDVGADEHITLDLR